MLFFFSPSQKLEIPISHLSLTVPSAAPPLLKKVVLLNKKTLTVFNVMLYKPEPTQRNGLTFKPRVYKADI